MPGLIRQFGQRLAVALVGCATYGLVNRPRAEVRRCVGPAVPRLASIATTTRTGRLGPAARPVAIPDDVDGLEVVKARGEVELPARVRWSGPPKTYDLTNRADRLRVYEQVLREGTDEDVRRFIEIDELVALWDDLVLPGHVGRAWADWLRGLGLDVGC